MAASIKIGGPDPNLPSLRALCDSFEFRHVTHQAKNGKAASRHSPPWGPCASLALQVVSHIASFAGTPKINYGNHMLLAQGKVMRKPIFD